MKKPIFKKIVAVLLSMSLFVCGIPLNGVAATTFLDSSEWLYNNGQVDVVGVNSNSLEGVFRKVQTYSSSNNVLLQNIHIEEDNGEVSSRANLKLEQCDVLEINTTGMVYQFLSESNRKTYLIDFKDTQNIHFVQARVDNKVPLFLNLLVQVKETEEYLNFVISLNPQTTLTSIEQVAIVNDSETAYSLYDISNNILNQNDSMMNVSVSSNGNVSVEVTDSAGNLLPQTRGGSYESNVDIKVWKNFFTAINNYEIVNINDYSIDERLLETGWVFLKDTSSSSGLYSLACYTSQNGSYEKILRITFMELIHHTTATTYAGLQMKITNAVSLSYDEISGDFDVLYYGMGPYIDDMRLGLEVPGGLESRTVFTSFQNSAVLEDPANKLEGVCALVDLMIPVVSTVYSLWDLLDTKGEEYTLNREELFEDSYDKQLIEHGSLVRRVIAGTTGNHRLSSEGDYFMIQGKLDNGYKDCSSWSYEYVAHTV